MLDPWDTDDKPFRMLAIGLFEDLKAVLQNQFVLPVVNHCGSEYGDPGMSAHAVVPVKELMSERPCVDGVTKAVRKV